MEAPERVVPEETALPEPEEPPPPPPPDRVFGSPAPEQAPVQAPKPDVAVVASGSSAPSFAPAPPERPQASQPEESSPRTRRFDVPPAATWERCEIEWWRGYVKSDFYAVAFRSTGEWYVAARSPSFRWRHSEPPPQSTSGGEEHAQLVGRLVADGWEPVGNGPVWYQTRFRRPVAPSLSELAGSSLLGPQGTGAGS